MVKIFLSPRFRTAVYAACLFCVVVGLKWATFERYGSAMPDWDQWDAEAFYSLIPWYEHDHFVENLFTPHNEHRVVITKLHNLALTVLNGQWDARLEAVTNAMVHGALATALWLVGRRRLASATHAPLWLLVVALFGLPLAWQNVLGGFHSQQYWLLLTSFTAIVLWPFARPWSTAWWAAAAAAVLALFTMGSGFLAAAVVLVVVAFRLLRRETTVRAMWPALVLGTALVAIGFLTRHEVSYHDSLKAKTAHDFFFSLVHSLQWPVPRGYDWLAAVLWLPWVLAAWRVVRAPMPPASSPSHPAAPSSHNVGQLLVALGGWVLVQLLATAYARGAGADFPASRYMDTLSFGTMVNGLLLAWLLVPASPSPRPWHRRFPFALTLVWVLTLACGIYDLLQRNLKTELPDAKKYYVQAEAHMRGYLATNDPAQLAFPDIPYPSAGGIIDRLDHPSIRALMPAVICAPLPLKPATSGPFLENHASELTHLTAPHIGISPTTFPYASALTWGTFDATGPAATGEWRSAPLTSRLGAWLKFETAGQLGASPSTLSLELRDASTDALLATIQPSKVPGDNWRAAYVRAPHVPFVVTARDRDSTRWLAFSAPVEMGHLSYLTWRATANGQLLASLAAVVALLCVVLGWRLPTPPLRAQVATPTPARRSTATVPAAS